MQQVFLSKILDQLKVELSKAQQEIIVAVAWFTNRDLSDLLTSLAERGVEVKVLICNHSSNKPDIFDGLVKKGGTVRVYEKRFMHNKVCIIDSKVAITGSYNWTYQAERNIENIIITDDATIVSRYNNILSTFFKGGADLKESSLSGYQAEGEDPRLFKLYEQLRAEIYENYRLRLHDQPNKLTRKLEAFENRGSTSATQYIASLVKSDAIQSGLQELYEGGYLRNSFEALVNRPEYAELFDEQTRSSGKSKLLKLDPDFQF